MENLVSLGFLKCGAGGFVTITKMESFPLLVLIVFSIDERPLPRYNVGVERREPHDPGGKELPRENTM